MISGQAAFVGILATLALAGCGVGPTPTPEPVLASDLMTRSSQAFEGIPSFEASIRMNMDMAGETASMSGEMALTDRKMAATMKMTGDSFPAGFESSQIMSPPYVFTKMQGLGADDTWFRVTEEELFGGAISFDDLFDGMSSPADMLGVTDEEFAAMGISIDRAFTVTLIGTGSVEGVAVDKYSFEVDWDAYWEVLTEVGASFGASGVGEFDPAASEMPEIKFERFEQWLDKDWFPRRMIMHMVMDDLASVEMDVTYRNVNGDVQIEEPAEFTDGFPGT